ncbi:uncharacterized protein PRCAT00002198001 [Priceomyces carsonii]|uniref:uncharacterized protein n=1 Tax=Priceomyces carsonii TaxID=28549 RepID=UPI002EDB580B|nr:unnamed protein product [Priceomyces carsonii]
MHMKKWDLESFIDGSDIPFEYEILKQPNNFDNWLSYYRFKESQPNTSLEAKVFLLERAVRQFPRSYKFWSTYLELVTESSVNPVEVLELFERSLQLLYTAPILWLKYLQFLLKQEDVTHTRRTFNRALISLPVTQHGIIWPLYIRFADRIGGKTGYLTYTKYLSYATEDALRGIAYRKDELELNIYSIMKKIFEFGHWRESSKLFEHVWNNFENYHGISVSKWSFLLEYLDSFVEMDPKNESNMYFESLASRGINLFPDQMGKIYIKCANYFIKRENFEKADHYFNEGIQKSFTIQDFALIFDAFADFEEERISNLSLELEDQPSNISLNDELECRMNFLEHLIDQRAVLLNDAMLRKDSNNLDVWFERVELFKSRNALNKALSTYAQGLSSINPLKSHSLLQDPNHLLPEFWISYAKEYSERNDFNTASLVFSKSVKSQYQTPEELVQIYIEWSKLYLVGGDEDKAIEIIETALALPPNSKETSYNDASVDVHLRIHKSINLWAFYLDLLESLVDNSEEVKKIERVIESYETVMNLKIATPMTVLQYGDFLERFGFFERAFGVYEKGIKAFKDTKIQYEIWSIYLAKVIERNLDIERIRDIFDDCLNVFHPGAHSGCPPKYCRPIFEMYSKIEREHGSLDRSILVLKKCIERLTVGLSSPNLSKADREKLLNDKIDIYFLLVARVETLNDKAEVRKIYEDALSDKQLKLSGVISLGRSFIALESKLKEFARVRQLFKFLSSLGSPGSVVMLTVWDDWENFELNHGNESTFKEMLRYKRTIQSKFMDEETVKNSINPMGFVKGTDNNHTTETQEGQDASETNNPDEISLEM